MWFFNKIRNLWIAWAARLFLWAILFFNSASALLNFLINWASMLLKCCLLHRDIVLPRYATFSIFVSMSASLVYIYIYIYIYIHLIYVIYFAITIFILITINHIISLIQTNVFGHVCQTFSLRLLLSCFLIICQFQPNVAHKSVSYKKAFISLQWS